MPEETDLPIDAEPTKQFFVDMITRDIQLEQAVLDLVDKGSLQKTDRIVR